MRILGISGSPRGPQSTTRVLVERVLDGARERGAKTEFIDICTVNVAFCTGCGACHVSGKCPLKDDFRPVIDNILAADGIVFGSPLYFNSVSAQLKAAIDRLSHQIHCQMLVGKYGCSVASAGGPESELATDFMNGVLIRLGASVVGSVGAVQSIPGDMEKAEQRAQQLGRDLVDAIEERRTYPEQEAVHAEMHTRFKRLVELNKDHWPYEYDYWVKHKEL